MSSPDFSPDWIKRFSDPYAVLGLSVAADERRISKRYRQIAKCLHPDQQLGADEATQLFAKQILTRLVNPAYQRLKQDKSRAETLATLRFKVRRLSREDKLVPKTNASKQLMHVDEAAVDVLYEKALTELSDTQYMDAATFATQTGAIAELNLIYLRRKMGDPVIREKRTGLVSAKTFNSPNTASSPAEASRPQTGNTSQVSYAQRHVDRAKTYIASKNYSDAIQELRDAVRIEPENSNYHSMLGQAYLLQKMTGMAKVHFRKALTLDASNKIARKYAQQLGLDLKSVAPSSTPQNGNGHTKSGGLLNIFGRRRATK